VIWSHPRSALLALVLTLAAIVVGVPPHTALRSVFAQEDHGHAVARLVVADATTHVVSVIDPVSRQRVASFDTPGKIGNVYPSSSGRWVFVVHTDANRVTILDTGLRLEEHDDHRDVGIGAPHVRGTVYPGRKPIDFWAGHGMATVHNDDDGSVTIFNERNLEEAIATKTIKGAGTGHNNAVVLEDLVLLSLASEGTVTAYGLADGGPRAQFDCCPRTHGWTAPTPTFAAAGCLDGVMLFSKAGDTIQARKVAEPDGSPENARVSTIVSHRDNPILIGNFGDGLALVHQDATMLRAVPLSSAPVRFAYDRDGARVIVLTLDGKVHAVDPSSGSVLWRADVVTAVDPSGAAPRPSLTVGETTAYVSDPTRGTVVRIDLATGGQAGAPVQVGGTPTLLTLVTMDGVRH
jgi:DNA-binding beta-propeller fold protein YncE